MRIFQIILITCTLFLLSNKASARGSDTSKLKEYSNSIKVFHGGLYIPKWFPFYKPYYKLGMAGDYLNADLLNSRQFKFMILGVTYERRIYSSLFASISYSQWKDVFDVRGGRDLFYVYATDRSTRYVGQLNNRVNYKMADLFVYYRKGTRNARHYFNAGLGVSYCWGQNDYVKNYWYNPSGQDGVVILEARKIDYKGIVPAVGYDFLFLSNRLCIGPDIRARFYSGRPEPEFNFNFHLGVNF